MTEGKFFSVLEILVMVDFLTTPYHLKTTIHSARKESLAVKRIQSQIILILFQIDVIIESPY